MRALDVNKLSDRALVARYDSAQKVANSYIDWFCNNGYGDLKVSDMRALKEKPLQMNIYLNLLEEIAELKDEAKRRYGPDLMFVKQLTWRKK